MHQHRPVQSRGFTLIELLITITVIGIIVAMAAGALMNAQDTAREQRTRSLIAKLHAQMMYRWESYQTRRIPMSPRAVNETPQQYAGRRLRAQRELMRLELPQRWLDITSDELPLEPDSISNGVPGIVPLYLTELPALSEAYLRQLDAIRSTVSEDFETAECLYLIVTMGHDDNLGAKQFRAADVGDVDNDGAKEFIDGWGRPISFVRWAPGYLPLKALQPGQEKQAAFTELQSGDPESDHDPFDPLRLDGPTSTELHRGMRLVPLIYSSGPDGISDIWNRNKGADLNDPYFMPAVGDGLLGGTPMTEENTQSLPTKGEGNFTDNITNHALGVR